MRFLPPKPPSGDKISRKSIRLRHKCMLKHQSKWKTYTVGVEPHVTVAVCSECGESHLISKGFITREEVDRDIDKALKMRLP